MNRLSYADQVALADALAWALDQIEDDLSPDHQKALEYARAVLARARGEGVQS